MKKMTGKKDRKKIRRAMQSGKKTAKVSKSKIRKAVHAKYPSH